MSTTSIKARFLVPILALVLAFAFAPAAFADTTQDALAAGELAVQADGDGNGIGPDITQVTVQFPAGTSYEYTGNEIKPAFKVIDKNGVDITADGSSDFEKQDAKFWFFYMNNVEVSSAITNPDDKPQLVLATFVDEYPWVYIKPAMFEIVAPPSNIADATITTTNETYTGKKLQTNVTVTLNNKTLVEGTDYKLTYKNNKKVGTAQARAATPAPKLQRSRLRKPASTALSSTT